MSTQTTSPELLAAARRRQLLVQRELARLRGLHTRSTRARRPAGRAAPSQAPPAQRASRS